MPNLCDYEMKVVGKAQNVIDFFNIMAADYNYNTMTFSNDKHMGGRVFEAYIVDQYVRNEDEFVMIIAGDCAWSVATCMLKGGYYENFKDEKENHSTTLEIESAEKHLEIEVYSNEPGVGFQEHYIFNDGELVLRDVCDIVELNRDYMEDEGIEITKENIREHFFVDISDEDMDILFREGYVTIGGFSWDYEI